MYIYIHIYLIYIFRMNGMTCVCKVNDNSRRLQTKTLSYCKRSAFVSNSNSSSFLTTKNHAHLRAHILSWHFFGIRPCMYDAIHTECVVVCPSMESLTAFYANFSFQRPRCVYVLVFFFRYFLIHPSNLDLRLRFVCGGFEIV